MSRHRSKPKAVTDIEAFGEDMTTIFNMLKGYEINLYTGGDHYLALLDLHLQLCKTTLAVTGSNKLPWEPIARTACDG